MSSVESRNYYADCCHTFLPGRLNVSIENFYAPIVYGKYLDTACRKKPFKDV
jgi:hypothetical protein